MPPAKRTPKAPADRLPKQDGRYHFELDGKAYSLPPAADGIGHIDSGLLMDATMGDQKADLQIGFSMLKALADEPTMAALRAASVPDMLSVVMEWANTRVAGVNLPESSSSSD